MSDFTECDEVEATEEELATLRELGVAEREFEGLTSDDAQEWIEELRAVRENAGRIGSH